jgi:hypothetical protein
VWTGAVSSGGDKALQGLGNEPQCATVALPSRMILDLLKKEVCGVESSMVAVSFGNSCCMWRAGNADIIRLKLKGWCHWLAALHDLTLC